MKNELNPTLWRTARALANADRLNLMRLVANSKGAKGVSELALEVNLFFCIGVRKTGDVLQ
jgi:hypothetical protein